MLKKEKNVFFVLIALLTLISSCSQPQPYEGSKPPTNTELMIKIAPKDDPRLLVTPLSNDEDKTLSIDYNVHLTLQNADYYSLDITKGADIVGDYTLYNDDPTIADAMIDGDSIIIKALKRGETTFFIKDRSGAVSNISSVRVYDLAILTPDNDGIRIAVNRPAFLAIETTGMDQREYEIRRSTSNLVVEPGKFIYRLTGLSSIYTFPIQAFDVGERDVRFALYLKDTDVKLHEWKYILSYW